MEAFPRKLAEALSAEAKNRFDELVNGVERYIAASAHPAPAPVPVVWRCGNARLLEYAAIRATSNEQRNTILLIPSLINRYYILDLAPHSFARYLAEQGFPTLLLDWGAPGAHEKTFNCGDYVRDILSTALAFAQETSGRKVTLTGYCMGGVLALAAAQLHPERVAGLGLLAAPWDFHAPDFSLPAPSQEAALRMDAWLATQPELAPDYVLALFYMSDPWRFEEKFRRFAALKEGSAAFHEFMALEQWVNDGVPLAREVARECLMGWAVENRLARGQWKVAGERIDPARLRMPCFAAVPQQDRVVPKGCAMPLVEALPHCELVMPSAGHVGMIVGRRAKKELWEKFVGWAERLSQK